MKLTSHAARRIAAAAITGTAIVVPTAALASASSAATVGSPASRTRPVHPVTAYVTNFGNGTPGTVTPINTATSKAGNAIKVGASPGPIAITPNGKTAYVSNGGSGNGPLATVTPIRTATNTAGKPITVGATGASPVPSRSRRTGRPPTSSTMEASSARPARAP